jgi:ABC-type multidrug transport system fused ATPase/permease subunit
MAEVEAAATSANAHSFIALLPNGYNTHVGCNSIYILNSNGICTSFIVLQFS